MPVRIGSGLSAAVPGGPADPPLAAAAAAAQAAAGLDGEPCDLALAFLAGGHLATPESTLEAVHDALAPAVLVGCGAGGVVGGDREVEEGTAVAVWAANLGEGVATPFHAEVTEIGDEVAVRGLPELEGAGGALLLPSPSSFPTDAILRELAARAPGVPVVGGIASARTLSGESALLHDDEVETEGAVGVRLDDVELLPCVSQGAAPVGPELTITAAEGNVIHELAGRPALRALRDALTELGPAEQTRIAGGVLLGIVVESGKPSYEQGDFLVRGLLGGDTETGAIAVGTLVEPGQVVRLHGRDADSADRDLRDALDLRRAALGGAPPAGALVFTCNGRGRGMFGVPDHDASVLAQGLDGAPVAGFFAAGEIGPVGGASHLHSFTATLALFA